MPEPKLIRECRMGPPKAFKTGAVVGSYPKPLLYFGFDRGGLDIVPVKNAASQPTDIKFDTTYNQVVFAKPGTMAAQLKLPEQPRICAFDYSSAAATELSVEFLPIKTQEAFMKFQNPGTGDYNVLADFVRRGGSIPFKTIVFDSMTGYMDITMNYMASFNPAMMADARVWAFQVGQKVRQVILSGTALPCHVVFIFHTLQPTPDLDANNRGTGALLELPNVYSKVKDVIGGLFSQYFYATKTGPKAVIKTLDFQYVKGLGSRWPAGLPPEIAPDFMSIYGKELNGQ